MLNHDKSHPAESVNIGRAICYSAFRSSLEHLYGRPNVTELDFSREWASRLAEHSRLTVNGWYDPPPGGIAVVCGRDDAPALFRFDSLRPQQHWPSVDRTFDWQRGLVYAYCSPVDTLIGIPADFGITLYFGNDPKIRQFYRAAIDATREILNRIEPAMDAKALYAAAEGVIQSARMSNNVSSITNSDPNDIGHSFPGVDTRLITDRRLPAVAVEEIRTSRDYICRGGSWMLSQVWQFTIEPNLISVEDSALPQFSPHYVVDARASNVRISDECDELFVEFGLA